MLKIFANPRGHFVIILIHGVEDGAFFVDKSSVLYMYHGTVYTVLNLIGAILVLTSDLCRLSLPVSVRKLVLTLSLSVNYLHELININPIF